MLTRALTLRICAVCAGATRQTHGLPLLLCLESAVILCFVSLVLKHELMFGVVLLRIGAVEGAVGLACLVGLVRRHGVGIVGFTIR